MIGYYAHSHVHHVWNPWIPLYWQRLLPNKALIFLPLHVRQLRGDPRLGLLFKVEINLYICNFNPVF